jgi:hypothetical protein
MNAAPRVLVFLLALPALLAFPGCSSRPGVVEGQVLVEGAPAAGAEVQAFVRSGEERSGTPFATGTSREDGSFSLPLPAGKYFLVGRKTVRKDGRDRSYKGEYAGNPVAVAAGKASGGLVVTLAEMSSGGFVPREGTGVKGIVASGGKPAAGAFVYAYPDNVGTVRGPAFAAFARTGDDGRFVLALREGSFLVVARDKGGENETGAMTGEGKTGEGIPVRLSAGETKDVGRIALHAPDEGKRNLRSGRGGQEAAAAEVRGTVVRDDGSPGAGVYVMAYGDHRMIGRPFAISGRTGADGAFALRLPRAGKYYLGARSEFGGPVSPGEWVGTYDGAPDHGVAVRQGEVVAGIRVRVSEKW